MRLIRLILAFFVLAFTFTLVQAQTARVVTQNAETYLLSYDQMIQVFMDPSGVAIVITGPKYSRYVSTQNFGDFLTTAKCNLVYFLDARNGNRLTSIPPGSIDQVIKLRDGKARILQIIPGSSSTISYDTGEPFDSIQVRMEACNIPAKTFVDTDYVNSVISDSLATIETVDSNYVINKVNQAVSDINIVSTGAQFVYDTVSAIGHARVQYEAVYEIGGSWFKTIDNGPNARVDGVVVAVPNANSFVVQKDGYFKYLSHPYSKDVQQFVQPNGSYSSSDTTNSIPYGYALNDSLIQIGQKQTFSVSKSYIRSQIQFDSTRQYIENDIVNLGGIQYVLTDTTEVLNLKPGISGKWVPKDKLWRSVIKYNLNEIVEYEGIQYVLRDTASAAGLIPGVSSKWVRTSVEDAVGGTGNQYEIPFYSSDQKTLQTILNFKIQSNRLQVPEILAASVTNPFGGSNELGAVIDSIRFNINTKTLSVADANVESSTIDSFLNIYGRINIHAVLTDTVTFDRTIDIDINSITTGQSVTILFEKENSEFNYKLRAGGNQSFALDGLGISGDTYILPDGDRIFVEKNNTTITLSTKKKLTEPIYVDNVSDTQYEADIVSIRGKRYRTYKQRPDDIPDSSRLVLKRLSALPSGENLFNRSEVTTHASTSCPTEGWSWQSRLQTTIPTDVLNIDGSNTLRAIVPTSGTSGTVTKWIDLCNQSIQFQDGDIVTLSFYLMALNEGHSLSVSEAFLKENPSTQISNVRTVSNSAITNKLKRFELEFEVTADGQGVGFYPGVEIEFSYALTDTFIFTSPQIERKKGASIYKPTGLTSFVTANDSIYLLPLIENRLIDLTGLITDTRIKTVDIQNAVDFCYQSGLCSLVNPGDGALFDDQLLLRENIKLYAPQEITVDVDINNGAKSAVLYTDDEGSYYTDGQDVININFNFLSTAHAAIDIDQSRTGLVLNCDIIGNDFIDRGVTVGNVGGGSVFTKIADCNITGTTGEGAIYYEDNVGASHVVERCDIKQNEVGIGGKPVLLLLSAVDIESNTYNISVDGGQEIVIDEVSYFESGDMRFNGVERISMTGGRISTGNWIFEGQIDHFAMTRVDMNNAVPYLPDKVSASFIENMVGSPEALGKFNSYYRRRSEYVNLLNNTSTDIGSQPWAKARSVLGGTDLVDGRVAGTFTGNLSGTIVTDNTTLTGGSENLLTYSDSISAAVGLRHRVARDSIVHPITGETTVDVLIPTETFNSPSAVLRTFTLPITPVIGEPYVFSFLGKTLSAARNTNTSITFTIGGVVYSKVIYPVQSGEWDTYYFPIDSIESTSTAFQLSIGSGTLGDTLAMTDFSLTRGRELRSVVRTGATAVYNQGAKLAVDDSDDILEIGGGVQIYGSLVDSDGDVGTPGQKLTPDGSGGMDWVDDSGTINTATTGEIAVYTGSNTIDGSPILSDKETYVEVTAPIRTVDGSTSVPVYSFINDTDLGLQRTGADSMAIVAGSAIIAQFSSTGINLPSGKDYRIDSIPILKSGTANPTTDIDGEFVLTHNLGAIPTNVSINSTDLGVEYHFHTSCGTTSCTVTVTDGTGTNTTVPSTSINVSWTVFK